MPERGSEQWQDVGEGVLVRRHRSLDLNIGLVVGTDACLVVDTRSTHGEAVELIEAIRRVTPLPWTVVNTHAHFDHCFGNAAFRPGPIWAHRRCAEMLREYGETQRRLTAAAYREHGQHEFADALELVQLDPPDRLVDSAAELHIGGRPVRLRHLGRGHTSADLVVTVPDAGVLFAGDLVEEGAPPSFGDAFPLDWPVTLDALLPLVSGPVVPGHGAVVGRSYVEAQRDELAELAGLARASYADGRPADGDWPELAFPPAYCRQAISRAYRQLRGDPPYDPVELLG